MRGLPFVGGLHHPLERIQGRHRLRASDQEGKLVIGDIARRPASRWR
jgi:hypothetical protein